MLQQDSSLTSILGDFSIPRMLEGENEQKPHNAQVISYCPDLGTEQLSPQEGLFQVLSIPLVNHSLFNIPLVSFVTWDFALSLLLAKQATRYHSVFLGAPGTIFLQKVDNSCCSVSDSLVQVLPCCFSDVYSWASKCFSLFPSLELLGVSFVSGNPFLWKLAGL